MDSTANKLEQVRLVQPMLAAAQKQVSQLVVGKDTQVKLALTCLLAGGHLLIEDVPGVGKTTLAHALAATLGLQFARVQFTSDLLPADLIGASIFDRTTQKFEFHQGPVFTQVLLADEINRASPKTQSALLEAMEERQVSSDGITRALPTPFFVIATQNPFHQIGTFALPESQLDRFLMCVSLGYPDAAAERQLLEGQDRRSMLASTQPALTPAQFAQARSAVNGVHVAPVVLDYLQGLLHNSRAGRAAGEGLSPRAGLSILSASRAWAMLEGRDFVLPEDVKAILPASAGHRLFGAAVGAGGGTFAAREQAVQELIRSVPIK